MPNGHVAGMLEFLIFPFERWTKLRDSLRVIENHWCLARAKYLTLTIFTEKLVSAGASVWGRVDCTVRSAKKVGGVMGIASTKKTFFFVPK